jgi:organic radical activating enzyme
VKHIIPYAEAIVTQVCTLVCPGCSTYSDLDYKGYTCWEDARRDIEPWLERIEFEHFGIMGGEPLVNPKIKDWIIGIRELMPNTVIRFPVNGTLVHKHIDVVDLLHEMGNVIFKITVHTNDSRINEAVELVKNRYTWEKEIFEYNNTRLVTNNNFKFQVNRPETFFKTFQNEYENAAPYDSNPVEAFDQCHQKECPLLINGRIYKCSTSGLMDGVLKRFNYPNKNQWEPYLDNNKNGSIGLDSTDRQIEAFVNNVRKPHATCRQCPTKDNVTAINHQQTVYFR